MFKVMLVDDERMILEGIAAVVDWAAAGTELIDTARNGLEAWEKITEGEPPHIIISDIRMPGMDGLQLVERVNREFPGIRFIMLSGFGEFGYAKEAMKFGVKHYLLKPCSEVQILEALNELTEELKQQGEHDSFIKSMREGFQKMLPHVKEQFLKEFVTNKTYGPGDLEYFSRLFEIQGAADQRVRLILFQLEGKFEFEHLFAIKNIAGELLQRTILSSTVGDHVLVVVEDGLPVPELHGIMEQVRSTFLKYYRIDLTIALSEPGEMVEARRLYKQTLACLNHRFYLGEGSLITERDIVDSSSGADRELAIDEERLLLLIKAGHWDDASREIDLLFDTLSRQRLSISTAKTYVIQWFMAMIRLDESGRVPDLMARLVTLMEMETLQGMQSFFKTSAQELTLRHYEQHRSKHSAIISKVLEIIGEQLGNAQLSLQWVSQEMLYMNADYLGKLFRKETGDKFSTYVMKLRIQRATELMNSGGDVKIYELAEQLGFGDNPQYFSQVFKKITGVTPSEYLKA